MTRPAGQLGRQIVRSVVVTSITSVVVAVTGLYLFYGILIRIAPTLMPFDDAWLPSGLEWMFIIVLCIIAGSIAAFVASRLAQSIVAPIIAVAEGARRLAGGDLRARVSAEEGLHSEVSMMVDDFNLLAQRLERASQAVTQWNAMIAHELRTPVTILRGRLQGLADGVFQPEPQLLRSLEHQVMSLSRLIDDLRTATLFDSGHLHVQLAMTDLSETVNSAVRFMRDELMAAGFVVETWIERVVCQVDGERIGQLVVALLENVKQHAHPGPVSISLTQDPETARLSVHDSGPGLPDGFEAKAFDPFMHYVIEGVPMKGTGLGLSVVRAIAEVHGGSAACTNVNGGACFVVTLPRLNKSLIDGATHPDD